LAHVSSSGFSFPNLASVSKSPIGTGRITKRISFSRHKRAHR
jgi:hypothetical protein